MELITKQSVETDMFLLNWQETCTEAAEQRPISTGLHPAPLNLLILPAMAGSFSSLSSATHRLAWLEGTQLHPGLLAAAGSWLRGVSHSGEQHNTSSCFPNGEIIQAPITEAAHFHENYKDLLSQRLLLICQIQVKFASGFDAYQRHTDRLTISHTCARRVIT